MRLVIFESPEKAQKVKEYAKELGWKDIITAASVGHFRELAKTGESKIGVIDWENITLDWEISEAKQKNVARLIDLAKTANEIILATDGDREGEAIAWHLIELLKPYYKKTFKRIRMNSITKNEFERQLSQPDTLNQNMVNAALARAVIDKSIGYYLSPKVWEHTEGKSAGRVQSVILKLIVERYLENTNHKKTYSYNFVTDSKATSTSFNSFPTNEEQVYRQNKINLAFKNETIKNKFQTNFKPFDALSATVTISNICKIDDVASILQKLFNNGFITYPRSDSKRLAEDVRDYLIDNTKELTGLDYVEPKIKIDASAQDAHPAITPATWITKRPPVDQMSLLEWMVYQIIYQNTLLSVTLGAEYKSVKLDFVEKNTSVDFTLNKNFLVSENNLALIKRFDDENQKNFNNRFWTIPNWEKYDPQHVEVLKTQTVFGKDEWEIKEIESQPKSLFTLNSIKEEMKKLDIARPSTRDMAAIINVEKGYVDKRKNTLVPNAIGFQVSQFLDSTEPVLIRIDFTKELEEKLDEIEQGKYNWKDLVKQIRAIANEQ